MLAAVAGGATDEELREIVASLVKARGVAFARVREQSTAAAPSAA
jgi:alkylhydroperoxidase/carboxymuconolactone decarboxylase family protein YurZ